MAGDKATVLWATYGISFTIIKLQPMSGKRFIILGRSMKLNYSTGHFIQRKPLFFWGVFVRTFFIHLSIKLDIFELYVFSRYVSRALFLIMEAVHATVQRSLFTHCAGHSLGSHVCGLAGKLLKVRRGTTIKKVALNFNFL